MLPSEPLSLDFCPTLKGKLSFTSHTISTSQKQYLWLITTLSLLRPLEKGFLRVLHSSTLMEGKLKGGITTGQEFLAELNCFEATKPSELGVSAHHKRRSPSQVKS